MSRPQDAIPKLSRGESVEVAQKDGESASGEALPEGWAWASLDDLGDWKGGGTPRKSNSAFWKDGTVPWVSPKDMKRFLIDDAEDHITTDAVKESSAQLLPKNSVMVVTRSGILERILPVAVNTVPVATNQDLKTLVTAEDIEAFYVAYLLKGKDNDLREECAKDGTTVASIDLPKLKAYRFGLAPKAEQSRIVSAIESLQERSSRARVLLSEVGPLIGQLRQSVLRDAFSGKLTADWRARRRMGTPESPSPPAPSEENSGLGAQVEDSATNPAQETASELLLRIRTERRERWQSEQLAKYEAKGKQPPKNWQDKYKEPEPVDSTKPPFELPEDWVWVRLEEVVDSMRSGNSKTSKKTETDFPILRSSAIRAGTIDYRDVNFMAKDEPADSPNVLTAGDLMVTRLSGSLEYVGMCAIVGDELNGRRIQYPDRLFRLRLGEGANKEFVSLAFRNSALRTDLENSAKSSAGHQRISLSDLRDFLLPLPPAEEQQAIVDMVVEAFESVNLVDSGLASMESSLTQLDQSILSKAFRGELVPQDPRDEPASELLARIRTTREKLMGARHNAKKKNAKAKNNKSKLSG